MRTPLIVKDASKAAYVVRAPRRSDPMTAPLRAAFACQRDAAEPFADLMQLLDRIDDIVPRRR